MSNRAITMPGYAMVLAAGLGTRLRPLTDDRPKPLVEVAGRSMLDRSLDRLAAAGVAKAVVNTHYLADKVAAALAGRRGLDIEISREESLLDTGGGVARVLPLLGPGPFYVINGDVLWLNGPRAALSRLAEAWREDAMDGLLLVHPAATARGYTGPGDFFLDQGGRLRRRGERETAPFVFTGVQLLHPRLFEGVPKGAFSLNLLYDRALARGRLHGLAHDGEWFHIGTLGSLALAEAELCGPGGHGVPGPGGHGVPSPGGHSVPGGSGGGPGGGGP